MWNAFMRLITSPWLGPLGIALSVLGIGLAFYFYRKSRKRRLAYYAVRNYNLVTDLKSRLNHLKCDTQGRVWRT